MTQCFLKNGIFLCSLFISLKNGLYCEEFQELDLMPNNVLVDESFMEFSNESLGKPQNLTVGEVTDTSMELKWIKPKTSDPSQVLEYQIYYINQNYTNCKKHTSPALEVTYNLTSLEPYAQYKVFVKASSNNHYGVASDAVVKQTDVSGPGPPQILNATCVSPSTLVVYWQKPPSFNKTVDVYIIAYREENSYVFRHITVKPCNYTCQQPCPFMCKENKAEIYNLTSEMYEIKIRGATRSIYGEEKEMVGRSSESRKVPMTNCGVNSQYGIMEGLSAGVIAGIVCVCFAFLLAIVAFVIWRNCFHAAYYYLEDAPPLPHTSVTDWDSRDPETTVPLSQFASHVASLHADGDIGFSKEYEAIQAVANYNEFTTEYSQHPENKLKNRYLNILAYDHSRVRLLPLPGQSKWSDYINANYIDGYQRANAYIGTQGPLPCTFDAFWRMIWEQGVAMIVMITNLVERGRRKCDMYWPKEGTEVYGLIHVKLIKEDILAMYTVRTLQISHVKAKRKKHGSNERLVYQYHYTNWPDHGTPDHPLPILSFVKKSSASNPCNAGPIVVHCSAGVGRTGTYIVLDSMLKQICHKNEVNVYGFLRHVRTQRNFLVQTEEQYIFIHDALLEAIRCSETSLSPDTLAYLLKTAELQDRCHEHWKKLEVHFKAVTAFQPKDYNLISANKLCNRPKNRSQQFVPVECSRVHLTPKPGVEGSDYINASWCLGFKKLREFIITQHPLASTVLDFWQMVWDHNAQTVVLLSPVTLEPEEYCVIWPMDGETLDGENFKVKLIEESELDNTVSRDLTVQSLQDDYELTVRIIQSPVVEPLTDLPVLFKLLDVVQQWHLEYQNGPIVVIDRFGGTEAATFCSLATLMKQLDYENNADICMYAKLYHNCRPGVWQTMDNYLLLYQALEILSASKGVSIVSSSSLPHPHPQPNGYTSANIGAS